MLAHKTTFMLPLGPNQNRQLIQVTILAGMGRLMPDRFVAPAELQLPFWGTSAVQRETSTVASFKGSRATAGIFCSFRFSLPNRIEYVFGMEVVDKPVDEPTHLFTGRAGFGVNYRERKARNNTPIRQDMLKGAGRRRLGGEPIRHKTTPVPQQDSFLQGF